MDAGIVSLGDDATDFSDEAMPNRIARNKSSYCKTADPALIVVSSGWFRCFRREEKAGDGPGSA
jgi:hypothetical protein